MKTRTKTFAMVKPIWHRSYGIGDVIRFIEDTAIFEILEMKLVNLSRAEAAAFYDEHAGKHFYEDMLDYLTSGPVVPMILGSRSEDPEAPCWQLWRNMLGATDSSKAAGGSLRARYGNKNGIIFKNVAHGSDAPVMVQIEAGQFDWDVPLVEAGWK
jgi:nucleoside-diphosphate kinase